MMRKIKTKTGKPVAQNARPAHCASGRAGSPQGPPPAEASEAAGAPPGSPPAEPAEPSAPAEAAPRWQLRQPGGPGAVGKPQTGGVTLRLLPWILLPRRSRGGTRRRLKTTVRVLLSSPAVSSPFSALPRRLPLVAQRFPLLLVVPRRLSSPTTTGSLLLLLVPRWLLLTAVGAVWLLRLLWAVGGAATGTVAARVAALEAGTGAVVSRTFPVVSRTTTVEKETQTATRTTRRWTNDANTQKGE